MCKECREKLEATAKELESLKLEKGDLSSDEIPALAAKLIRHVKGLCTND